jgi:hypothetical protein
MNHTDYKPRQCAGALANGSEKGGKVWHAVAGSSDYSTALCGRTPRIQWRSSEGQQITCPKCLKKLAKES